MKNFAANYALAQQIRQKVTAIPGAVDVHLNQVIYAPELLVNVDRTRAQTLGLNEGSVASSMLFSLSGSGQASPNYWLESAERRELYRLRADAAVQDEQRGGPE